MMLLLREWILGLTAACILSACALSVGSGGPVKRVTRMICGLVLTAVLLSPLGELDMESYSFSLADYRRTVTELTRELSESEKRLDRLYIEQEAAAYILDEAHALGLEGRVEVSAKWRNDCWIPWETELWLPGGREERTALTVRLEAELGIPAERQIWHGSGE